MRTHDMMAGIAMSPAEALGARLEADVIAAGNGDAQAFGRLVDETKSPVAAIALAISGDHQASQDIAQEVFLAAWRNLGTNAADPSPDPAQRLSAREERTLVAEALAGLPEDTREVLVLFYREGESVAQVADLLELTPDAVKQRLSRGRRRLRESVEHRLAGTLAKSAPGAAFTAAVLAGLHVGAAPVAAASVASVGTKVSSASSLAAKFLPGLGGIVAGAAGGVLGVVLGIRYELQRADEAERPQLERFRAVGVGVVLLAMVGFAMTAPTPGLVGPILVYLGLVGAIAWMYLVWLRRIMAPRLARERAADPAAASRQRWLAVLRCVGLIGGATAGGIGLVAGFVLSGQLPAPW